jgi:ribonucleotide reductase alpha subunit
MWDVKPSNRYNWDELKENIKTWGLRNSLLLAPMPTASTSQILGNNECIEPFTSNIYTRRTLAGEFIIVNKHLIKELLEINMWNESIKDNIIKNRGSVQQIIGLPDSIKEKFKIVWELSMKDIIDMSSDRGAFICQSQSLNLWVEDPDYKTLTSMHFYSWIKGLKTGMYYLRRKAKHQPQQFTIEPDVVNACEMCSG